MDDSTSESTREIINSNPTNENANGDITISVSEKNIAPSQQTGEDDRSSLDSSAPIQAFAKSNKLEAHRDSSDSECLLEMRNNLDPMEFIVGIERDDPEHPLNWPFKKKSWHTIMYGLTTFTAQFNSGIMLTTTSSIMTVFNIKRETALLTTTLYVLGVALGPLLFAPISEIYGRKVGVLMPFFISFLFTIACAASYTIDSILVTRFFSGLFASAPIVSSGGVLADIWAPSVRGNSLVGYAAFVVLGPVLAPIISTALDVAGLSWRWPLWVVCMIYSVVFIVDVCTLSETYVPILQTWKARKIRFTTGNWAYHARHEEWKLTFKEFATVHLMRPFAMFATPIVFFIAMFASYVFGVFYLMIVIISVTFQQDRHWSPLVATLPMLALLVGTLVGGGLNILATQRYRRIIEANNGAPIPEERLPMMMYASWLMPAGIFMFAWTAGPNVHWILPVIGIALIGCGFFVTFQGCLNYLVDAFTRYAASAIAANTFTRSILGAIFPLFGYQLYANLGVHWGASLLGFVSLGMLPIPYVFYRYGAALRAKNPYIKLVT